MSDDPRGQTLWEMLMDWLRGERASSAAADPRPAPASLPPAPNPLGWDAGATVQLSPRNGEAFTQPVTVEEVRQVVRQIGGQSFDFVDYVIRPSGHAPARVRCVPDRQGESRLLLECVDRFPVDDDFLAVVNDDTGVFDITDDDTGATDRFARLNGVQGPYDAIVRVGGRLSPIEYWDWARVDRDGDEEFVFVEHLQQEGEIEIWRGRRLLE